MTREEAITMFKRMESRYHGELIMDEDLKIKSALNMAIKALEQEPILDKIRAEISALKSHHINDHYDDGFQGCRTNVLQIIDKYRAERSDEV